MLVVLLSDPGGDRAFVLTRLSKHGLTTDASPAAAVVLHRSRIVRKR